MSVDVFDQNLWYWIFDDQSSQEDKRESTRGYTAFQSPVRLGRALLIRSWMAYVLWKSWWQKTFSNSHDQCRHKKRKWTRTQKDTSKNTMTLTRINTSTSKHTNTHASHTRVWHITKFAAWHRSEIAWERWDESRKTQDVSDTASSGHPCSNSIFATIHTTFIMASCTFDM